jgi:hypothetical protein
MNNSTFNFEFEHRGTYLYAHLTGEDSFAASLDYWNQMADKVRELKLNKLLVHEKMTGTVSEGEMFDLVSDLLTVSTALQVAVYDENCGDQDINQLGQLIASNRGIDIMIFQSLEDAETWLTQD